MVVKGKLEGTWLLPYRRRQKGALAAARARWPGGWLVVSSLACPGPGWAAGHGEHEHDALLSWPVIATRAGTGHLCVCAAPLTSRASSVFCVLASCGAGLPATKDGSGAGSGLIFVGFSQVFEFGDDFSKVFGFGP